MYIKDPDKENSLGYFAIGRALTNSELSDGLNESLERPNNIGGVFTWKDSPEGADFWCDYCEGVTYDKPRQRIRQLLSILTTPPKPFNKEDWL